MLQNVKYMVGMAARRRYNRELKFTKDCTMEAFSEVARDIPFRVRTNVPEKKSMVEISKKKSIYMEEKLYSGKWPFQHMRYILNPYGCAPLTAASYFYTEKKTRVRFTVKGHTQEEDISDETAAANYHIVPIYGLYAGECNEIGIELLNEHGRVLMRKKIYLKTTPLPEELVDFAYDVERGGEAAWKLYFITGSSDTYPCAVDCNGNIRYYLRKQTTVYGVFPLNNGRFLYGEAKVYVPTYAHQHAILMHEMDFLGRVHNTFIVKSGLHHFATELPNGNIIGVSNTMENASEDCLVEIDRNNGRIVKTIRMIDILGSHYADMVDWVHPNAIQYFEETGELQICLRNVHSVIRIDYRTQELLWILGTPNMWKGTGLAEKVLKQKGEIRWHYQAHAACQLEHVRGKEDDLLYIMLFDNHRTNRRPSDDFDEAEESFVTIYGVDEKEKTVCRVKEYPVPKSLIRSNAQYDYRTNRVLAMAGVIPVKPDSPERRGEIIEFDYVSGRPVNRMKTKASFFSVYEFRPCMREMARPVERTGNYIKGEPAALTVCGKRVPDMEHMEKDSLIYECYVIDDLFFFKAKDHSIDRIYLVSDTFHYVMDYTDTYQTMERFADGVYYMLLSLWELCFGEYRIVTEKEGVFAKTEYTITIE